jgi:hypothetical protein
MKAVITLTLSPENKLRISRGKIVTRYSKTLRGNQLLRQGEALASVFLRELIGCALHAHSIAFRGAGYTSG